MFKKMVKMFLKNVWFQKVSLTANKFHHKKLFWRQPKTFWTSQKQVDVKKSFEQTFFDGKAPFSISIWIRFELQAIRALAFYFDSNCQALGGRAVWIEVKSFVSASCSIRFRFGLVFVSPLLRFECTLFRVVSIFSFRFRSDLASVRSRCLCVFV